jgi:hypothetical protein
MDTGQRFNEAWRARSGLKDLDHPTFSGVSRVWRAVLHPTFHDDVSVTVTELDRGGFIELRVVPADARTLSMLDAGLRAGGRPPEPAPTVWEAALPSPALEALAAQMPRLPLHATSVGRDGMTVDHEALVDGATLRFSSWSPTPASAPLHHAYVVALCTLAARTFTDPAAQAAVQPLAGYLR